MKLLLLLLTLVFLLIPFPSSSFSPNTSYFLDCGSTSTATLTSDFPPFRNFIPDSRFLFASNSDSKSVSNPNPPPGSSPLYSTARVFTGSGPSSYSFALNSAGTHFLRLHFYPFRAQRYDLAAARFNVSAFGRTLLLSDFSPQLPLIKEYLLPVDGTQKLCLTFVPSPIAFVSAIEVFTAPANLLPSGAGAAPKAVPTDAAFGQAAEQALETVYRINVGGPEVTPASDTLWRTWQPDKDLSPTTLALERSTSPNTVVYSDPVVTAEIAPVPVYDTARIMNASSLLARLTWSFPVAPAYKYFVRLHFCDIVSLTQRELAFDVYISDTLASGDLRPGDQTAQLAQAFFVDFATDVPSSDGHINVSIGPSNKSWSKAATAILNGLEIMRVNNSVGSLTEGAVNPDFRACRKNKSPVSVAVLVPAIAGGLLLTALAFTAALIFFRRRRKRAPVSSPYRADAANSASHSNDTPTEAPSASPRLHLGLQFSLMEIKLATNDFDERQLVGVGGFGKVYKGVLRDGTKIAAKRGMAGSKQGHPEFQNEIIVLSKIRHRHLVSLIGYCDEQSEMILVYEYMENGTLRSFLYGSNDKLCLSWKQRLQICIDAARGLHYLHTGYSENIIHRDVKSTNILLTENFLAKVADFGLSRLGPSVGETHVSTNNIKGTFGYLDPEYFKTMKLTDKSDVYSFGVMLFEVLCARPVIDPCLPREQQNVAEWALHWQRRGELEKIADPNLAGEINPNSLRKFGETAAKCVAEYAADRPAMGDVLWNLEYALQLQVTELRREPYEDSVNHEAQVPVALLRRAPSTTVSVEEENDVPGEEEKNASTEVGDVTTTRTSEGQSDIASINIFSQLITDEGR